MKSHYRLTPEIEQRIVSYVRGGGFPWVAAEAAGIPRKIFRLWLRRGKKPRARKLYRDFYQVVLEARAQARLSAELETRKNDPRFWLRHGPGRERPGVPGWANPVKPIQHETASEEELLMSRRFMECLSAVMPEVAGHPEARFLLAKMMEKLANELKQKKPKQKDSFMKEER